MLHVRVGFGKRLRRRLLPKNQHRAIGWVRQSAGYHQFSAAVCLANETQMFVAKRSAADQVIVTHIIKENVMHQTRFTRPPTAWLRLTLKELVARP